MIRLMIATAMLVAALDKGAAQTGDGPFNFALVGDMPYSKIEEQQFANLITKLNEKELAFVVHVGDMQLDARNYEANAARVSLPCNDEYDAWFLGMLQRIRHPVVVTPGDNDWTDCHFLKAPKADPLDRLTKVRSTFFPEGKSLGQRTIALQSQAAELNYSKFRENLRWSMGGVTFATVHIVGSNDNFGRTPEMDEEYRERKAANIAWIRQAFASARTDASRGLVLMTQANPYFENRGPASSKRAYLAVVRGAKEPEQPQPSAFDDYITELAEEMEDYEKPVAFLHGDFHRFRIDHPLFSTRTNRRFENFIRVETYGSPDIHWVKVTVDPAEPHLFRFDPQIVPENVANHRAR